LVGRNAAGVPISGFILYSVTESMEASQCECALTLPSTALPSFTPNTLANEVTAMSDRAKSDVAACLDKLSDISKSK